MSARSKHDYSADHHALSFSLSLVLPPNCTLHSCTLHRRRQERASMASAPQAMTASYSLSQSAPVVVSYPMPVPTRFGDSPRFGIEAECLKCHSTRGTTPRPPMAGIARRVTRPRVSAYLSARDFPCALMRARFSMDRCQNVAKRLPRGRGWLDWPALPLARRLTSGDIQEVRCFLLV